MSLTKDEEAKVLQWLRKWEPGQCAGGTKLYGKTWADLHYGQCDHGLNVGPHDIPQPPLTKADAIDCLEKLAEQKLTTCIGPRWVIIHNDRGDNLAEADTLGKPAEAIFRAVLAYRDAQEKK